MKMTKWTTTTLLIASTALAGYGLAKTAAPQVDDSQPQHIQASAEQAQASHSAYLGVAVSPIDQDTAKLLGTTHGIGLIIEQVAQDTPAQAAGLKVGDVVTKLNDQLLINAEQFAVLVRTFEPGQAITLHVIREGEPMQIKAELIGREMPALGPGGTPLERHAPPTNPFDARGDWNDPGGQPPMLLGPDNFDLMIQQMQQRMLRQRGEMDRMMRQMQERLGQEPGAEPQRPVPDADVRVQAESTWSDGQHTLQLNRNGESRWLKITSQNGDVLFDGKVPDNGQIEGLPNDVQRKVDQMLKANRIEFRMRPAPGREAQGPVA